MDPKTSFGSLTRSADFVRLREAGFKVSVTSWLFANAQVTELAQVRVGWTIPKQVGCAVMRNRLRRWGREFFRQWAKGTKVSVDINLIFRRQPPGFYRDLSHREFDEVLQRMSNKLTSLARR